MVGLITLPRVGAPGRLELDCVGPKGSLTQFTCLFLLLCYMFP